MKELIEKILIQEVEAVRELLKNPIDWKAESKHPWWPPLNAATIKGNFEIVKLLLENACPLEDVSKCKKEKMTALHFAAELVDFINDNSIKSTTVEYYQRGREDENMQEWEPISIDRIFTLMRVSY
jgi:hypothetical protein